MRRRLFTLAFAVSLLLCVATAVLWVRSYFVASMAMWEVGHANGSGYERSLYSNFGRLGIRWWHGVPQQAGTVVPAPWSVGSRPSFWEGAASPESFSWWWYHEDVQDGYRAGSRYGAIGFYFSRHQFPPTQPTVERFDVWVPYWFVTLAFAALPVRWVLRRKRDAGFCRRCRYDLTGNTSGVCPECGTTIPQASRPPRTKICSSSTVVRFQQSHNCPKDSGTSD